jgi:pimeloyl-ACP methyl ester carboxylesterase
LNNDNYSNWLKTKFGSTDYKNASPTMRAILVKIVNENLTTEATKILCPTELVYGECDTETPIIMGQILNKLINNSILHIIPKENHYSVLSATQHQVIYLLKNFINKVLC